MSRIDDSIKKMNDFIEDIEKEVISHSINLGEEGKKQVRELADKTILTINNSINKLNEMKEKISDDSQLDNFLERLELKCKDVADFTKAKIDEIKPATQENINELKADLEKGFDDFKKEYEDTKKDIKKETVSAYQKLLENENIKSAIKLAEAAKDKIVEFYNDPRTQKAINQAKLKTIELAEKGLDGLKEILDRQDKNTED